MLLQQSIRRLDDGGQVAPGRSRTVVLVVVVIQGHLLVPIASITHVIVIVINMISVRKAFVVGHVASSTVAGRRGRSRRSCVVGIATTLVVGGRMMIAGMLRSGKFLFGLLFLCTTVLVIVVIAMIMIVMLALLLVVVLVGILNRLQEGLGMLLRSITYRRILFRLFATPFFFFVVVMLLLNSLFASVVLGSLFRLAIVGINILSIGVDIVGIVLIIAAAIAAVAASFSLLLGRVGGRRRRAVVSSVASHSVEPDLSETVAVVLGAVVVLAVFLFDIFDFLIFVLFLAMAMAASASRGYRCFVVMAAVGFAAIVTVARLAVATTRWSTPTTGSSGIPFIHTTSLLVVSTTR